jgi:hypothetical protein
MTVIAVLMIAIVILTVLVIRPLVIHPVFDGCGRKCDYGIRVDVNTIHSPLNKTGLDADSIKNITNGTFTVVVGSGNASVIPQKFNLLVEEGSFKLTGLRFVIHQDEKDYMTKNETVYVRLVINSTDPDIRSLILWGKDNNETFKVLGVKYGFDVVTSKELEDDIFEDKNMIQVTIPPYIYLTFDNFQRCIVC